MQRSGHALQQDGLTPSEITDAIVAQTSLGIWALDADDRTVWVNPRMAEMVGSTPEEMLGRPVYDFLAATTGEHTQTALERRRTGISELREVELRGDHGVAVQAVVESLPLLGPDGDYRGAVAMVGDITRLKATERNMALLAALVRCSSDAIVACDLDGAIRSWNPSAEALFGWTANEMHGRSLSTILKAGAEGVIRLAEAAVQGDPVRPIETDAVAKDRSSIPVELTAFPVDDGVGRAAMVAVTLRDVRERRETE